MPDDTGTETTRSDAPSADESLFGDAADDAAAAVAEEQHANEEPAQDRQGSEDAEEEAGQPEDLKVVVSIKGGRATIGVQRPSSDPHIESFDDGDLAGLTQEAPEWAGFGAGGGRRGRGGRPTATRDAEAVLGPDLVFQGPAGSEWAGGRTHWRRPPALRSDRMCRRFCICAGNGLIEDEAAVTQRWLLS